MKRKVKKKKKGRLTISLGAGSLKIENSAATCLIDGDFQLNGRAIIHVIDRFQRLAVGSLVNLPEHVTDGSLGCALNLFHCWVLISVTFHNTKCASHVL